MNITLSVDEQVAQRAREAAQKMGKSLNQAVRDYLEQLAGSAQRAQHAIDSSAEACAQRQRATQRGRPRKGGQEMVALLPAACR